MYNKSHLIFMSTTFILKLYSVLSTWRFRMYKLSHLSEDEQLSSWYKKETFQVLKCIVISVILLITFLNINQTWLYTVISIMASDGLSDLQKMELKEAFDEFDKVTFTQVTNPNIFFILKGVSIFINS